MPTAKRRKQMFLCAVVLVTTACVISLFIGKYPLSPAEIGAILFGGEVGEMQRNVFFTLRLPRVLMALLAGFGLGMAGSVYQTIFRNPLASPDIIGVANGANLGAAIAIVVFGHNTFLTASFSFLGGLLVMLLVVSLVRMIGHPSTTTYILAGIIFKAASESGIMLFKFFADPEKELAAIEFWSMGSFGSITGEKLGIILPFYLVGLVGLILLRRQISLLGLEEEESRMLGVRVAQMRFVILLFSTLLVTSIICLTGLISFVGLIAPHIAQLALKRSSFASSIFAALSGAFILLVSDCLARTLYSAEIPISIFTTFIGIPFLIYFMRQRRAR